MTTKTIYLPTVYVDEATGEIIEKEQLINFSYISKLITNIERNGTTKSIVTGKQKIDRKSTRLNSSHITRSRMPSSA